MPNQATTKVPGEDHPNVPAGKLLCPLMSRERKYELGPDQKVHKGQKSPVRSRTRVKPDPSSYSNSLTSFSSSLTTDSQPVFCPGELNNLEHLEAIHSFPHEPFPAPELIPPPADIAQLDFLWAKILDDKMSTKSGRSQGKLSPSDRGSTFFNPRFMRLFTDILVNGRVQQAVLEEPQSALKDVMKDMRKLCEETLKKSGTKGPNLVGEEIWLRDEYDDHTLRDTIDAEINDLQNNETSNEEEWVVRLWLEVFLRHSKSLSRKPPCLIRFLQCRMETVHIDKAHNNEIHPRYPPIVEPHQMKDANSMGASPKRWDNYHPDRNGYVYFDVSNGVKVENNWDPDKLRDLPLLRVFEGQKHVLLSFIAELKPEVVGDISGDALRKKVEHYLLTNGATYLHERLKLRALGSGNAFEVGHDFIIHLISGVGPRAYHYICRLRPASTKDQLEEQIARLKREREKVRSTRQRAQLSQESLNMKIAQLARGEENVRYEIVLMGTYDLKEGDDRDKLRRTLNEINQVALTVQLEQMIEDIGAALHKTANKADPEMAFYWKRDIGDGNYKICWDNAPYVDDTDNDIYENLRSVLRSAPEGNEVTFGAQSTEDEADITEDI